MASTYKFYSDAGHGWLAVKRAELIELDLIGKISHYSYQRGNTVYLEEDCDLNIFVQTKKLREQEFKVVDGKFQNRSPIRSYNAFRCLNDNPQHLNY